MFLCSFTFLKLKEWVYLRTGAHPCRVKYVINNVSNIFIFYFSVSTTTVTISFRKWVVVSIVFWQSFAGDYMCWVASLSEIILIVSATKTEIHAAIAICFHNKSLCRHISMKRRLVLENEPEWLGTTWHILVL